MKNDLSNFDPHGYGDTVALSAQPNPCNLPASDYKVK